MVGALRSRAIWTLAVSTSLLGVGLACQASGSRPVNRLLPWHDVRLDTDKRVLAWYRPQAGLGFDHVLRLGWGFLEQRVPSGRGTGVPVYLTYAVFDEHGLQGTYWQHDPAALYSSFVDGVLPWYAYSGDLRALRLVQAMLDYDLRHGMTPSGWAWPLVPFPTSCGGARQYGRCFAGMPRSFYGGIEPDKVGQLGLAYLRFYELTGACRYLEAALRCARALAVHVRPGDATHTPWAFRVDGRTGRTLSDAEYGGAVVALVRLLDEIVRLKIGDTALFRRTRNTGWRWLLDYPLNPESAAWNRWSGYYEDVGYNPRSLNQAAPMLVATYLLERPRPEEIDKNWDTHVRQLVQWVRATFGRGPFFGAWGIDEQRAPGRPGCCSRAGLGSDTSRWAAVNALLAERTGNRRAAADATRSLAYATYFARNDGLVSCCGDAFPHPYWFSDGYADYLGSFSRALGALPELAPRRQDHLLHSTSVVQKVTYGERTLEYRTFDQASVEVIRLRYRPRHILADARPLALQHTRALEGFVVQPLGGGDFAVRVRHDRSHTVRIDG